MLPFILIMTLAALFAICYAQSKNVLVPAILSALLLDLVPPNWTPIAIGFYVAIGIFYAYVRWVMFIHVGENILSQLSDRRDIWVRVNKLFGVRSYPFRPIESTARILGWVIWWPGMLVVQLVTPAVYRGDRFLRHFYG